MIEPTLKSKNLTRRHAWVELKRSPLIQNIRKKNESSNCDKSYGSDLRDSHNGINNECNGSKQPLSPCKNKFSKDIKKSKEPLNHKNHLLKFLESPSFLEFRSNTRDDCDETQKSMREIKRKVALDVREIEQTLKEYNERRSLMKKSVSFSQGTNGTGLVSVTDKPRSISFHCDERSSIQKDENLSDTHHNRNEDLIFRRTHSYISNCGKLNNSLLSKSSLSSANPAVRVAYKINLISKMSNDKLKTLEKSQIQDSIVSSTSFVQTGAVITTTSSYPSNISRKRKKAKGKTKRSNENFNSKGKQLTTLDPLMSPITLELKKRDQHRRREARKREIRAIENKKRREKIEKQRIKHIQENSFDVRRERYREVAMQKRRDQKLTKILSLAIVFGSRMGKMTNLILERRELIRRHTIRDLASGLITRKLRHYCFRCHRKRIRGAIRILGAVFVLKVRQWRIARRNHATDVVKDFLLALKETGAFLGLMTRGKKWRAYKEKVIIIQNLWRAKMIIINAQIELIDRQWQKEKERRIAIEVDHTYEIERENALNENEIIDASNRGRRMMNIKLLPKKKISRKTSIRLNIMEKCSHDILNYENITPIEIRVGILKEVLKYMKQHFMEDMNKYKHDFECYSKEVKRRQRAGAFIKKNPINCETIHSNKTNTFSKNSNFQTLQIACPPQKLSFLCSKEKGPTTLVIPIKPLFRPMLGEKSLSLLLLLAEKRVEEIRNTWDPSNMKIDLPDYRDIGKQVALCHYQEIDGYKSKGCRL